MLIKLVINETVLCTMAVCDATKLECNQTLNFHSLWYCHIKYTAYMQVKYVPHASMHGIYSEKAAKVIQKED